jgi:plastocyanin
MIPIRLLGAAVVVLTGLWTMLVGVPTGTAQQAGPQMRNLLVATVPLVVHEQEQAQPGLQDVFSPTGVLADKEIYGFYPDTLVVYQGDTLNLRVVNAQPEDEHTFTLAPPYTVDLEVAPNTTAQTSFVATQAGVFTYICRTPEHLPYMTGTLVVLPVSPAPTS